MVVEPIFESYGNKLIGVPNNEESGGSGGHVIENSSGTDLPQEDTLQFADSHVTDDSTNSKTVVETFKAVTEAEYSSETEDGAYIITDGNGATIGPASEDYVQVVADGVKTYATLLNELYALVDKSKLNNNSYVRISSSYTVYKYSSHGNVSIKFFYVGGSTNNYDINLLQLGANQADSLYIGYSTSTSSTAINNVSSNIVPNGRKITLYYGNRKATVDLQTMANRCVTSDGETVQQKLNIITSTDFEALTGATIIAMNAKKQGNVVYVYGTVQKVMVLDRWNDLVKLPDGFYDTVTQIIPFTNSTKDIPIEGRINNGVLSVLPTSVTADTVAQNIAISFTIIIN